MSKFNVFGVHNREKLFSFLVPVISILLALVVGAIIILCLGKNPLVGYGYLVQGALSSPSRIAQSLTSACPLIFTSLCVSFAYKCGVFNLGGEGQFIMGACATLVVLEVTGAEGPLAILLGLIVGIIAGGIWGLLPGLMKITRGLNELITTIMLNYVATLFMGYIYTGPFREGEGGNPQTAAVVDSAMLPKLDRMHIGVIIAILLAFVVWYVIFKTSFGFKIRAVGLNPTAAKVAGFPVKTLVLLAFVISGAIAGLGGSVELLGKSYRLMAGFGSGFGFSGVAIALIAQLNPIGSLVVALFFGMLQTGSSSLQVGIAVPSAIIDIIRALIIIFAVSGMALLNMPQFKQLLNGLTPMDEEGLKPPTDKKEKVEVTE
jgi:simple sugar transport system permease protein